MALRGTDPESYITEYKIIPTLSVGTLLCPNGIAYRRTSGSFTQGYSRNALVTIRTVEYEPSIQSQLASRNEL